MLEDRGLIFPDDIDRLCREAGARAAEEVRTRKRRVDPTSIFVTQAGVQLTMAQWAKVVDEHRSDVAAARRMLELRGFTGDS